MNNYEKGIFSNPPKAGKIPPPENHVQLNHRERFVLDRIKKTSRDMELTIKKIAKATGYSMSEISSYFNERKHLDREFLKKMEIVLEQDSGFFEHGVFQNEEIIACEN